MFQEDSGVPALVEAVAEAYVAEVARLAHGVVVEATAGLALRSDGSHAMRCLYAARLRTVRHDAACTCLQGGIARRVTRWSARRRRGLGRSGGTS